ncbi:cell division protein [Salipaludibacillus neizhouensis]|uniref:Cell division protein n=1 Tax=Salipaludibacillus neizhouensis TaxID=885475 RepID=A0A3A9JYE4_9BACI|nr:septum formation initiator family protein [Salipaludibacillus neizhouensis]RKL65219.1 cell division protein [Salipaludibacillus neizhouensis]
MQQNPKTKVRQLTSEYMEKQELLTQQRKRRRKGLVRRLSVFAVLMIIFFSITGVTLFQQQSSIQQQEVEQEQLDKTLSLMEKEQSHLTEEIQWLQDPEYIAELARRDYFLTKPGETLFQLPRTSSDID